MNKIEKLRHFALCPGKEGGSSDHPVQWLEIGLEFLPLPDFPFSSGNFSFNFYLSLSPSLIVTIVIINCVFV